MQSKHCDFHPTRIRCLSSFVSLFKAIERAHRMDSCTTPHDAVDLKTSSLLASAMSTVPPPPVPARRIHLSAKKPTPMSGRCGCKAQRRIAPRISDAALPSGSPVKVRRAKPMRRRGAFTVQTVFASARPPTFRQDLDMDAQLALVSEARTDAVNDHNWADFTAATVDPVHYRHFLASHLQEAFAQARTRCKLMSLSPGSAKSEILKLKLDRFRTRLVSIKANVSVMMNESEENYWQALTLIAVHRIFSSSMKPPDPEMLLEASAKVKVRRRSRALRDVLDGIEESDVAVLSEGIPLPVVESSSL